MNLKQLLKFVGATATLLMTATATATAQTHMWAIVTQDGGLMNRGEGGAVHSEMHNFFSYRVQFERKVSNCARVATVSDAVGIVGENEHNWWGRDISLWLDKDDASVVWVALSFEAFESANNPLSVKRPFHLIVVCPD